MSEPVDISSSPGLFAENIVRFARALRRAGAQIGPGSVLDAIKAVAATGLTRRDDVRAALKTTLIKSQDEAEMFDRLFSSFWRRRPSDGEPDTDEAEETGPSPATGLRLDASIGDRSSSMDGDPGPRISVRQTPSEREIFGKKDFAGMTEAESGLARRLLARLDFNFAGPPSRRWRADPRGRRIAAAASFRKTLRTGGNTIAIVRQSQVLVRPPIVALCDVSGSMHAYARIFLHFLQALTSRRTSTQSFLFGTSLTNVTRAMRERDADESLARVSQAKPDWSGGTRIATSLHAFNRNWSRRTLQRGAVVLLFTDGLERDPGHDLDAEMRQLHARCGRLIWLNPLLRFDKFEPKARGARAILAHVDEFRPIHNLESLADLVRALETPISQLRRKHSENSFETSARTLAFHPDI